MPNAGSQQQVRIIGRASSIKVRKILWTCREIGIAYTFALNPNNQFPVLVDSDGPIWESNTICRYLAAQHGRVDLLPMKPRKRASVEQWMGLAGHRPQQRLALCLHGACPEGAGL